MPMPGTPLADQQPVDIFELVRLIAVTPIALPEGASSPGSWAHPAFMRGSGTLFFRRREFDFYGDKLLTAKNPAADVDVARFRQLGLQPQGATAS